MIFCGLMPSLAKKVATSCVSVLPSSVKGRSSSSPRQFGQSARPCRKRNRSSLASPIYLNNLPSGTARARIALPKTLTAGESIAVVTELSAGWQILEELGIAAPEHHIVCDECLFESGHHSLNFTLPILRSETFPAGVAQLILHGLIVDVRKIAEFERQNSSVPEKSRSKPGPQTEKEHAATMIAAERLHSCVVNNAHRFPERLSKIETHPTFSKVLGLIENLAVPNRSWKTDSNRVVFPIGHQLLCFGHELARGQGSPGTKFAAL